MKKTITFKNVYLTINLIFSTLMIFYEFFSSVLVMFVSFFFVIWSVIYLKKRMCFFLALVYTSIAMIPTSFISIIGDSTETFPLAWYHILVILLVFFYVKREKVDRVYLIGLIVFFIYALTTSLLQLDIVDAIKQILMISLFLCSFLIGKSCIMKTDKRKFFFLYRLYTVGAMSVAIQVLIQYFVLNNIRFAIGHVGFFLQRIAYGGLMGDFSFATTYIATGVMAVFLEYFEYRSITLKKFLMLELILISGMVTVTARTGIYALAITISLYFLMCLKHFKMRYLLIIVAAFLVVPSIIEILMANRSSQTLLDDSGRTSQYIIATKYWIENILFGIGFGLKNLQRECGIIVPHNFFIQYLLQGGMIGLILILLPFAKFIKGMVRKVDSSIWLFILVCISSMAIPDIVSSRFFYAIIILNYMSCIK